MALGTPFKYILFPTFHRYSQYISALLHPDTIEAKVLRRQIPFRDIAFAVRVWDWNTPVQSLTTIKLVEEVFYKPEEIERCPYKSDKVLLQENVWFHLYLAIEEVLHLCG